MMARHGKKKSASRSVGYVWQPPGGFEEGPVERVLERAVRDGTVVPGQYDTGRGAVVWLVGYPGAALRAVRDAVTALVGCGPSPRTW